MTTIETVAGHDDYPIAVRRYRPAANATQQLILLHGVVSHSEWLSPIAERLSADSIDVICPDRRGTGLNEQMPGDAHDKHALIGDVRAVRAAVAEPGIPMHIGGFCWGATYAIACIENAPDDYESLTMIAPSVFPAADVGSADIVTGSSDDASLVPNVPIDRFTSGPAYDSYIIPDPLRTRAVSPRFNATLVAMNALLGPRWAKLKTPTLMLLASHDRLSDNTKHERAFATLRAKTKKQLTIDGEHGLQFDAPAATAAALVDWLTTPHD